MHDFPRRGAAVALLVFGATVLGCAAFDLDGGDDGRAGRAMRFDGLGDHGRAVTTTSPEAQRWFDQGLVFTYAFNHDEAIRSFEEAARLDPDCAMNWWGIALCHGPHINNPIVPPERGAAAWSAVQEALARRDGANATERALIDAVAKRYSDPPPDDRKALDEAYAAAMREVWRAHPDDADVGTLYAEALLDVQPWDLWNRDGSPKGNTPEIVAVLEDVMRMNPRHPGALHLYIHAIEGSPEPERAMTAADTLRDLVPAAGHLVHMPSHIDVLTGRWSEAVEANLRAIEADDAYREHLEEDGLVQMYMAHDNQMLSFAAMMQGRSELAIDAAREIRPNVPASYVATNTAYIEPFFTIEVDALVRFGKWDEILDLPQPPETLVVTNAMWRFARAVAYAAKGEVEEARAEQAEFAKARAKVPEERLLSINPAQRVLAIADLVMTGEIAYREGNIDAAVATLREAIAIEDELLYMEPPEWTIPVRHALGAILLEAGRFAEAEAAYREDLANWPENGWALFGLAASLRGQGKDAEAARFQQRFADAWRHADMQLAATCLCVAPEA